MLIVISAVCDMLRSRRVRNARERNRRVQAKIAERLGEIELLKAELRQLVESNSSWVADKLLIKLFNDEIEEAERCYRSRRYRVARRCTGSAKATLICIERNIRAMRLSSAPTRVIN